MNFKLIITLFSFLIVTLNLNAESLDDKISKKRRAVLLITTYDKNNKPIEYGTGFFISSSGKFLTNHHVLKTFLNDKNNLKISFQTISGESFSDVKILKCSNEKKIDLCVGEVISKSKIYFFDLTPKAASPKNEFALIGHNQTNYFSIRKGSIGKTYSNIGETFGVLLENKDNLNVPMFSLEGYEYLNNKCKGDSGAPVYDPLQDRILGVFTECFIGKESNKVIKLAIDSSAIYEYSSLYENNLNFTIPKDSIESTLKENVIERGRELDYEIKNGFH